MTNPAEPIELDVAAAVMQRQISPTSSQTLAMRRSSGAMQGYWEFPGGKREAGESMSECLVREIKEELNLTITVGKLLAVNKHHAGPVIIKLHAFMVIRWTGDIKMVDHDKMLWLGATDLQSVNWSPADIPFVQMLIEQ